MRSVRPELFVREIDRGRQLFNSRGNHVAVVTGHAIFSLTGQKLYDLRGVNIYKLNGDLVGHLSDAKGAEKHLDKATDRLFLAA
jgi:hypothetical protein